MADEGFARTWLAALEAAATLLLRVDVREIGGVLVPRRRDDATVYDIVLYDNTPGGAGHVGELCGRFDGLLQEVERVLRGSETHDAACTSPCQA